MCTTRAPADDDSDVWGSGSDNETSGQDELQREAAARQQRFYNSGYREGLDEGKERTLQDGFNAGFRQGLRAGQEWGRLKGLAKSLRVSCPHIQGADAQWQATVSSLSNEVEAVKDREAMLATMRELITQPLAIEDFSTQQATDSDPDKAQAIQTAVKQSTNPSEHGLEPPSVPAGLHLPDMTALRQRVESGLRELQIAL